MINELKNQLPFASMQWSFSSFCKCFFNVFHFILSRNRVYHQTEWITSKNVKHRTRRITHKKIVMALWYLSWHESAEGIFCCECFVLLPFLFFKRLSSPNSNSHCSIFSVASSSFFASLSFEPCGKRNADALHSILHVTFKHHLARVARQLSPCAVFL